MNRQTKEHKIIALYCCVLIVAVCLVWLIATTAVVLPAAAQTAWVGEIRVTADDTGYTYDNGVSQGHADTLQGVLDAVREGATAQDTLSLMFDNISTDEALTLSGCHYVLNGSMNVTTANRQPLLTIGSGANVTWRGLIATSGYTVVQVSDGGKMTMESGQIMVQHSSTEYMCNAINVYGSLDITGGIVRCQSEYTSGAALFVGSYAAAVHIGGTGNIELTGNSAAVFSNGEVVIDNGHFAATHPTYGTATMAGNTASGFALHLPSDASVIINGGTYESVTPANTIFVSGNSTLTYNGGTVSGNIRMDSRSDAATVCVGNKRIKATTGVGVSLCVDEGEAWQADTLKLASYNADGYQFLYWNTPAGLLTEPRPALSTLPDGDIGVIATNAYEVTFVVGELSTTATLAYATEVSIAAYAPSVPEGMAVQYWLQNGTPIEGNNAIVKGADKIEAVLSLIPPTLEPIADIDAVYTPDGMVLQAVATHSVASLEYCWYKQTDNGEQQVGTAADLSLTSVTDSGVYRMTVTATYMGYTASVDSDKINVVYRKADSIAPTVEAFEGTYSRNQTLQDMSLPQGFAWVEPSTVPTCDKTTYEATYCLDTINYNAVTVAVDVQLQKATVTDDMSVTRPSALYGKYDPNKTLADYALAEHWRWIDDTLVPNCTQTSYAACFNPDSTNYQDYTTQLGVILERAQYSGIADVTLTVPYTSGMTLATVLQSGLVPTGYAYAGKYAATIDLHPQTQVYEYEMTYNIDPNNWVDCTGIKLYVTVTKGTPVLPDPLPVVDEVYRPDLTLYDCALPDSAWRWKVPNTPLTAGEHKAEAVYNPNSDWYVDVDVTLTVRIFKATPPDGVALSYTVTYRPDMCLADIALDEGYTWQAPDTEIHAGAGQRFEATYSPEDPNYSQTTVWVEINVNKGTLDMSGFVFQGAEVVWDGAPHSLAYSGTLPAGVELVQYVGNEQIEVGSFEVQCVLRQTNTLDYEPIADTTYRAVLVIVRATPAWEGDAVQTFVYNGELHMAVVSVNNTEQTVQTDIPNSFAAVGVYTIVFAAQESAHYHAAEYTVQVRVLANELESSQDDFSVTLRDDVHGLSGDLSVSRITIEGHDLCLQLSLSQPLAYPAEVIIRLPDGFNTAQLRAITDSEGAPLAWTIDDDGAVNVTLQQLGMVAFDFERQTTRTLAPWQSALFALAGMALGVSIAAGMMLAARRKENESK